MADPERSGNNIYTLTPPIDSALEYFGVVVPSPQVITLADVQQKQADEKERRARVELVLQKREQARSKAQEAYDNVGCNGYLDIGDETCIYINQGASSRDEVVEQLIKLARITPADLVKGTDKFHLRPSGSHFNTLFLRDRVMAFIGGYMLAAVRDHSPTKMVVERDEQGEMKARPFMEQSDCLLDNNNIELAWNLCNLLGPGSMLRSKEVVDELAKQPDKKSLYERLVRLIIRDGLDGKVSIPDVLLPKYEDPRLNEEIQQIVTLPVGDTVVLEEGTSEDPHLENIA